VTSPEFSESILGAALLRKFIDFFAFAGIFLAKGRFFGPLAGNATGDIREDAWRLTVFATSSQRASPSSFFAEDGLDFWVLFFFEAIYCTQSSKSKIEAL
jgi:hypothetical protein